MIYWIKSCQYWLINCVTYSPLRISETYKDESLIRKLKGKNNLNESPEKSQERFDLLSIGKRNLIVASFPYPLKSVSESREMDFDHLQLLYI